VDTATGWDGTVGFLQVCESDAKDVAKAALKACRPRDGGQDRGTHVSDHRGAWFGCNLFPAVKVLRHFDVSSAEVDGLRVAPANGQDLGFRSADVKVPCLSEVVKIETFGSVAVMSSG
jgi:hypothetical protein